jgi:hypothetical protein
MIISDLQYLESADNFEIQGGKCSYAKTNTPALEAKTNAFDEQLNFEQNSEDVYIGGAKRAPVRGQ